jgi:hypothetical protein
MTSADSALEALARGRYDYQYFAHTFLGRTLHDSQLEFMENSQAKINALATANRWGKTTVLSVLHFHAGIYKTGAEWRYMNPNDAERPQGEDGGRQRKDRHCRYVQAWNLS